MSVILPNRLFLWGELYDLATLAGDFVLFVLRFKHGCMDVLALKQHASTLFLFLLISFIDIYI